MSVNRLVNGSCVRNGTIDTMPPAGKLEFPDGRPKLYRAMLVIVACTFAAWLLISYLIPRYWSVPIADKAHPDTIRLDGAIVHISTISHWLFTGSFIAAFITILSLVGLGFYYRLVGVAGPPMRDGMTRLDINREG
jgi:hypothetical protein